MEVLIEEVFDLPLPDTSAGRSEGLHVSAIIRCLATEHNILKPQFCEELSLLDIKDMSRIGIIAQLRIQIGIAWENYYIPTLKDVMDHPGEMCLRGVYMSPDGKGVRPLYIPEDLDLSVSAFITPRNLKYVIKIVEVKATYKSTKTVGDMSTQWMWLAQLKSYCKAAGTRFAELHALFLCGDYIRPISPKLIIYHIEFTQQELDDNWTLLTEYADYRMAIELEILEQERKANGL